MLRTASPTRVKLPSTTQSTRRSGFSHAARQYLAYTSDLNFICEGALFLFADIIAWHVRGTRDGIKVDPSGLLASGEQGVQLTWMDAKVGDWVVHSEAWQASRDPGALVQRASHHDRVLPANLRMRPARSVMTRWQQWQVGVSIICSGMIIRDAFDVINGVPPDPSIRPNQIFAVSLP